MDDDDDEDDDEEDTKPSTFAEAQPKVAEMTPDARADCTSNQMWALSYSLVTGALYLDYARYYASLEAQQSESSSAAGISVLHVGSQQTYSSAASSPAVGSIYSPLPSTKPTILPDNDYLDRNLDGDDKRSAPGAQARKRPREDDDFADTDDGEQSPTHPQEQTQVDNTSPAKSGIVVHGE